MSVLPALMFEPDGYVLDGPKLMGRQAAGHGFLRAAIGAVERAAKAGQSNRLVARTANRISAEVFVRVVREQSPEVKPIWLPAERLSQLAEIGALYLPGPGLAEAARQRLRAGPAAWSLTGLTHTLCSHLAMDAIVDLLVAPVMPWDALVCTSTVAQQSVRKLFEMQGQYLAWRFGVRNFAVPQTPVIPLGVHAQDFAFTPADRAAARARWQIADGEVVALFAGRLSFHAKAHPYPMIVTLEDAAIRAGKPVRLLLCGQFQNDSVRDAFFGAVAAYAPHVRAQWVDGKDFVAYNQAWAASDIFISLSDNVQETFGITPLEAMAAGLPVLVSDWDGYKDTVEEGVTGFRIPTWMPPPDNGMPLAAGLEAGTINYDLYIGFAALEVSVDNECLTRRLTELISDPALRARMGAAGRARVAQRFEWSVVITQYQALWRELDRMRRDALAGGGPTLASAPRCAPARQDPYRVFASFPTHTIGPDTLVALSPKRGQTPFSALRADPLFNFAAEFLPPDASVDRVVEWLAAPRATVATVAELAAGIGMPVARTIRVLAPLAKVGWVTFTGNAQERASN